MSIRVLVGVIYGGREVGRYFVYLSDWWGGIIFIIVF